MAEFDTSLSKALGDRDRAIRAPLEAEIITLREQRDTLLKACKAALNCTGMTWYENGGTIGGKELNDQLRAAILEVEGEK